MRRLTRVWLLLVAVAVIAVGRWIFRPSDPQDAAPDAAIQDPVADYLGFAETLNGGGSMATEAIDPRTLMSQQQERLVTFFQRAADAIGGYGSSARP